MATAVHIRPTAAATLLAAALTGPSGGAAPPGPPPPTPTAGSDVSNGSPDLWVVIGGFVLIALAALITISATKNFPYSDKPVAPVAGLTIFAVFFVAAQGIERLLEPIASLLSETKAATLTQKTADAQSKVDAAHAVAARGANDPAFVAASAAAQAALNEAAKAKAEHDRVQADRTVGFWAIASSVGIIAAAILKLYLLTTVGVASPGRVLDIIATGLIIGAGTKPLHDLVTLITAQKQAAAVGP